MSPWLLIVLTEPPRKEQAVGLENKPNTKAAIYYLHKLFTTRECRLSGWVTENPPIGCFCPPGMSPGVQPRIGPWSLGALKSSEIA